MVTVPTASVIFPSPVPEENDAGYWNRLMRKEVDEALNLHHNTKIAKNIILFLGDGMGVTANTAGRILKGQKAGRSGEEGFLVWEKFPNTALLKTYNLDKQVGDSASTATSYLCGVKSNYETLGLTGRVRFGDCPTSLNPANRLHSLLKWAQDAGKVTGLVTTTRVTHATPAALYAKAANRYWECDTFAIRDGAGRCKDIARQLIEDSPGRDIKVVLGGGRTVMGTPSKVDDDYKCYRTDGRNLAEEWRQEKERRGEKAAYVTNTGELLNVDLNSTDFLMGLFSDSHFPYHVKRDANDNGPNGIPTLTQMTQAALGILKKAEYGFFLMVESGLIDLGLHRNQPVKALEEVVQLDEAVSMALTTLNLEDTLILVTADHSHTLTLNGFPPRGNDIFGTTWDVRITDGLPYTTLMFTTGQGYNYYYDGTKVVRRNLTGIDTNHPDFTSLAAVPTIEEHETHGGEDVAVYASGPMAHLFHRVHEQTYVAHVMAYAGCLGPYLHDCPRPIITVPADANSLEQAHHSDQITHPDHSQDDTTHSEHDTTHSDHSGDDTTHSEHDTTHSDHSEDDTTHSEHDTTHSDHSEDDTTHSEHDTTHSDHSEDDTTHSEHDITSLDHSEHDTSHSEDDTTTPSDHSEHTGGMDHSEHTGGMDHSEHTGGMNHSEHTGGMNHSEHTGGMNHSEHTGGMDHSEHTGGMDHSEHTGGMDHSEHTGGMDHSEHTDHSEHSKTEEKEEEEEVKEEEEMKDKLEDEEEMKEEAREEEKMKEEKEEEKEEEAKEKTEEKEEEKEEEAKEKEEEKEEEAKEKTEEKAKKEEKVLKSWVKQWYLLSIGDQYYRQAFFCSFSRRFQRKLKSGVLWPMQHPSESVNETYALMLTVPPSPLHSEVLVLADLDCGS
ncbi:hypothetical protein Pcinc_027600 [Petrolisthes cinctipes]|uniref:Alkaline phosphatase n=1 Tax=Petrolisthes cinctipes TaxID=88211 RepID=A0AAE1KAK3_PETCI|nr:hypothetical protein Pcinc_027600 [Petrolisthes cinctipes]